MAGRDRWLRTDPSPQPPYGLGHKARRASAELTGEHVEHILPVEVVLSVQRGDAHILPHGGKGGVETRGKAVGTKRSRFRAGRRWWKSIR